MTTQLGIFAKYWEPGRVKTRLAAVIGDQPAAELAHAFLRTLLRRFQGAADRCVIGYTPDDRRDEFQRAGGDAWRLVPQAAGDLGQRMRGYFADAFAAGADRVVLIGMDAPSLPADLVDRAFATLKTADLVLVPAEDGGYCLVGARGAVPPIFDAMPWSEPSLWHATAERLDQLGWREGERWQRLAGWYDVDTVEELRRLRSELVSTSGDAALAQLAADIDHVLA